MGWQSTYFTTPFYYRLRMTHIEVLRVPTSNDHSLMVTSVRQKAICPNFIHTNGTIKKLPTPIRFAKYGTAQANISRSVLQSYGIIMSHPNR